MSKHLPLVLSGFLVLASASQQYSVETPLDPVDGSGIYAWYFADSLPHLRIAAGEPGGERRIEPQDRNSTFLVIAVRLTAMQLGNPKRVQDIPDHVRLKDFTVSADKGTTFTASGGQMIELDAKYDSRTTKRFEGPFDLGKIPIWSFGNPNVPKSLDLCVLFLSPRDEADPAKLKFRFKSLSPMVLKEADRKTPGKEKR